MTGPISSSGNVGLTKADTGTMALTGANTYSGATIVNGGTLAPGASTGVLTTTSNLTFASGATFSLEINGTTVGTGYDQMIVGGDVTLDSSTLSLALGFTPSNGDLFTVILNNGVNAVSGTFLGLANGDTFNVGGQDFRISYFDDASTVGFFELTGGNDVTLLAVPEPSTAISLLSGLGMLLGVRRRRNE